MRCRRTFLAATSNTKSWSHVVERAHKRSTSFEFLEDAFVIDVEPERLRGRVEVRAINEQHDPVTRTITTTSERIDL